MDIAFDRRVINRGRIDKENDKAIKVFSRQSSTEGFRELQILLTEILGYVLIIF